MAYFPNRQLKRLKRAWNRYTRHITKYTEEPVSNKILKIKRRKIDYWFDIDFEKHYVTRKELQEKYRRK